MVHGRAPRATRRALNRLTRRRAFAALEEAVEQQWREGNPDASVEWILSQASHYYKNPDDREHWLDGLRKAGLPEYREDAGRCP